MSIILDLKCSVLRDAVDLVARSFATKAFVGDKLTVVTTIIALHSYV